MIDFQNKSLHEIASDRRVQEAVNRLNRLREAERAVSQLSVKLAVAEQDLLMVQREVEKAGGPRL